MKPVTRPARPAPNRAAPSAARMRTDAARLASVKSHPLRAHPFGSGHLLRARHTKLAQSNFNQKKTISEPPKRI